MTATFDAGFQAGGRPPAPGRLGLVQAFVNTSFDLEGDRGSDLLTSPAGLARWLQRRGLRPGQVTRADLATTLDIREGLRAQLAQHNGAEGDPAARERLRDAAGLSTVSYEIAEDGLTVPVPAGPGVAAAMGLVLAVTHEAQTAGTWQRLKVCPGNHCGWAFYDASRNRSSRWCSMQVCGGRQKARAYRARSHFAA